MKSNESTTGINLYARIARELRDVLQPLPEVLAGWEGGSIAFGVSDEYSDIDLTFLVSDSASLDRLYAVAEVAIGAVSPITCSHSEPPGRYYKLRDGGDYQLVDLCFLRVTCDDHGLNVERHGRVQPLFDKGSWLTVKHLDTVALEAAQAKRCHELQSWFAVSQSFVRKAILRGRHVEALSAYWAYTLKPLAEILRIRYCPERWDFGMRYLDRDLPRDVYDELRALMFVGDSESLESHVENAGKWGEALLLEMKTGSKRGAAGA